MAYPDTRKKIKFMKGSMKYIVSHNTTENEMVIPDRESMQAAGLAIYLHGYKDRICRMDMSAFSNIEFMSTKIELIYRKLSNSVVGTTDENYRGTWQITWPCKELSTVSIYRSFYPFLGDDADYGFILGNVELFSGNRGDPLSM